MTIFKTMLAFFHQLQVNRLLRAVERDRREFSDLNAEIYKSNGRGTGWAHDRMLFLQRRIERNRNCVPLLRMEHNNGMLPDYALYAAVAAVVIVAVAFGIAQAYLFP